MFSPTQKLSQSITHGRFFWLSAALLCLLLSTTQTWARAPLNLVEKVDFKKYAGTWYEIARLPNFFERKCVTEITATYGFNKDGKLTVTNRCVKADGKEILVTGVARKPNPQGPDGELEVRFMSDMFKYFPFAWADYHLMDLSADYEFAVVGHPSRSALWILSRKPQIEFAQFERMKKIALAQGFELEKLIVNVVPERPSSDVQAGTTQSK